MNATQEEGRKSDRGLSLDRSWDEQAEDLSSWGRYRSIFQFDEGVSKRKWNFDLSLLPDDESRAYAGMGRKDGVVISIFSLCAKAVRILLLQEIQMDRECIPAWL